MLTVDFRRLGLRGGNTVLDLGCGGGRHVRGTRRLAGIAAVALDLDVKEVCSTADSLRSMDRQEPGSGGTVPGAGPWLALQGNSYQLPFGNGTFDCVIASEILEHLVDDGAALREISRVLRPGGRLVVSVPRWGPEAVCWALSAKYRHSEGGHVRIYRRRQLRRQLAVHGYRVFAGHFAHGLHSPYWWLRCLVGIDRENARLVRRYHEVLVWDLFQQPRVTRVADRLLTPLIGKSVVLYALKG